MRILNNTVENKQNVHFIYAGLNCISDKSRKHLKDIAQMLVAIQAHPGCLIPDSIGQEIMRNLADETLPLYDSQQ